MSDTFPTQLRLFHDVPETRKQRIERLLSGKLRDKIKPASTLLFDYDKATAIALSAAESPAGKVPR